MNAPITKLQQEALLEKRHGKMNVRNIATNSTVADNQVQVN